MSDQVFISYSTDDGAAAEGLHDALQAAGIQCWIAHHDIKPGDSWGREIRDAIRESSVFLLILSEHANRSQYVLREVTAAVDQQIPILTVRIADVLPSEDLYFFLSTTQWLSAFALPATEQHKLVIDSVRRLLAPDSTAAAPATSQTPDRALPTTQPVPARARLRLLMQKYRKAVLASAALLGVVLLGSLGMNALPWWRGRDAEVTPPSLAIATPAAEIFVGDTFHLQATLTGASAPVRWRSGDTSVVKVAAADSLLRAVGAGSTLIHAVAGANADSVMVTVKPPTVATLTIDPLPALPVGDSIMLRAVAKDASGRVLELVQLDWSSLTPRILSIAAGSGVAFAVNAGTGRVRVAARTGSVSQVAVIKVQAKVQAAAPQASAPQAAAPPPTSDTAAVTRPLQINPGPRISSTITAARMNVLAAECIAALRGRDRDWLEKHYNPADATDHANLRALTALLNQQSYRVTREEVYEPNLAGAAIEFRVDFTYRRFTGGSATEHATFRVVAASSGSAWNLATCRVQGSIARD